MEGGEAVKSLTLSEDAPAEAASAMSEVQGYLAREDVATAVRGGGGRPEAGEGGVASGLGAVEHGGVDAGGGGADTDLEELD